MNRPKYLLISIPQHHVGVCILVSFLLLGWVFLSSCQATTSESANSSEESEMLPVITRESTLTPHETTNPGTDQVNNTPDPETPVDQPSVTTTPTPDIRLDPSEWMTWPVVPTLSGRARQIYQSGLASGRDPHSFSKVGDCQSIREVLLGIYDLPGRYILAGEDALLLETVDHFAGSFNRDGYAVKGGFNAATVLSPIWADPEVCEPGENPLACEIRVHNPSMIIISLEVWWDGRTPERYEQYMRNIVEYAISQGVLPILSTKADNVEGDHSINLATARLAYEYDIPLWNFWLAAQALPYQGIDPDRDGFHITVDAWNERSYTALKTLDSLLRSANAEISENTVYEPDNAPDIDEEINAPEKDFSQSFNPMPNLEGTIFLQLEQTLQGNHRYAAGIYAITPAQGSFVKQMGNGHRLLDSMDGFILVKNEDTKDLSILCIDSVCPETQYQIDLDISSDSALFIDSKQIVAAGMVEEKTGIYLVNANTQSLLVETDSSEVQVVSISNGFVYWTDYTDCVSELCTDATLFRTNILSADTTVIITGGDPKVDSSGTNFLYYLSQDDIETIYYLTQGATAPEFVSLYGNVLLDYAWNPEGTSIVVLKMVRSDYYGKANEILHYRIDVRTGLVDEYQPADYLSPSLTWSPDGAHIITGGTFINSLDEYGIGIRLTEVETGLVVPLEDSITITAESIMTIATLIWKE